MAKRVNRPKKRDVKPKPHLTTRQKRLRRIEKAKENTAKRRSGKP
jgi:hypothetical protein